MKNYTLFILLLLLMNCSQKERRNHVINLASVNEGDNLNEVVSKMESKPDVIRFSDSLYYRQETVYDLTTFVYLTPRAASSNIHIYFKDCVVFYIYYD